IARRSRQPAAGLCQGDGGVGGEESRQCRAPEQGKGAPGEDQGQQRMRAARAIVTAFANVLAVSGLGLLLILAGFPLLDGFRRALAGMPIDLVREIGDMVAAIAGACCLPIALLERNNIVLRTFDKILPAFAVRLIDTLAAFVVGIVMLG